MSLDSLARRVRALAFRGARAGALALAAAGLAASAQAQILAFKASLDGNQETPPVPTAARGTAWCIMDRAANTLRLRMTFTGLTSAEVNAHIHGFSAPGVPSGVKFALPLGNHKDAVWNYVEADEASIIAGLTYINIHSANFTGGEIRGQILLASSDAFLVSKLDGAQETPPNNSTGQGTGWLSVDTVNNSFDYQITFHGLGSAENNAHIHGFSGPGVPSGIKFPLPLGSTKSGTIPYFEPDESGILTGLTYFNIHTVNFGAGEIRGQILSASTNPSTYCTAKLNSLGCLPAIGAVGTPSASAASGFVVFGQNVRNNRPGLLFYGLNGGHNAPFQGGTLCVLPPVRRTPVVNSFGNPAPANDCSGVYKIDMNSFAQGTLGGTPAPQLQVSGTVVNCQWWGRDQGFPAPNNTTLTDGLQYIVP